MQVKYCNNDATPPNHHYSCFVITTSPHHPQHHIAHNTTTHLSNSGPLLLWQVQLLVGGEHCGGPWLWLGVCGEVEHPAVGLAHRGELGEGLCGEGGGLGGDGLLHLIVPLPHLRGLVLEGLRGGGAPPQRAQGACSCETHACELCAWWCGGRKKTRNIHWGFVVELVFLREITCPPDVCFPFCNSSGWHW
jgi:hypothetical protein